MRYSHYIRRVEQRGIAEIRMKTIGKLICMIMGHHVVAKIRHGTKPYECSRCGAALPTLFRETENRSAGSKDG